jgi:DNA-binding HxlR family transcriptional regulator
VRAAAELISHAWDPVVLSALRLGPTRRSELLPRIAGVSDKVLTESLRRLASRGLVTRAPDGEPARQRGSAVYQLSPLGESFANGPLAQLAQWAADNQDDLAGLPPRDNRAVGRAEIIPLCLRCLGERCLPRLRLRSQFEAGVPGFRHADVCCEGGSGAPRPGICLAAAFEQEGDLVQAPRSLADLRCSRRTGRRCRRLRRVRWRWARAAMRARLRW